MERPSTRAFAVHEERREPGFARPASAPLPEKRRRPGPRPNATRTAGGLAGPRSVAERSPASSLARLHQYGCRGQEAV